jgi:hypothetical protein
MTEDRYKNRQSTVQVSYEPESFVHFHALCESRFQFFTSFPSIVSTKLEQFIESSQAFLDFLEFQEEICAFGNHWYVRRRQSKYTNKLNQIFRFEKRVQNFTNEKHVNVDELRQISNEKVSPSLITILPHSKSSEDFEAKFKRLVELRVHRDKCRQELVLLQDWKKLNEASKAPQAQLKPKALVIKVRVTSQKLSENIWVKSILILGEVEAFGYALEDFTGFLLALSELNQPRLTTFNFLVQETS